VFSPFPADTDDFGRPEQAWNRMRAFIRAQQSGVR
jgi:hypothetical protein